MSKAVITGIAMGILFAFGTGLAYQYGKEAGYWAAIELIAEHERKSYEQHGPMVPLRDLEKLQGAQP